MTPDSEYEVRIRAMNRQGWSQLSEPFYFTTAGTTTTIQLSEPFYYTTAGTTTTQLSEPFYYTTAGTTTIQLSENRTILLHHSTKMSTDIRTIRALTGYSSTLSTVLVLFHHNRFSIPTS